MFIRITIVKKYIKKKKKNTYIKFQDTIYEARLWVKRFRLTDEGSYTLVYQLCSRKDTASGFLNTAVIVRYPVIRYRHKTW